jgi:sterol desaturase/sphingolipid hydroxylase (fatty acid hydroxylase superfamily)
VADTSTIASALAPGVALTSAVIYWANLQSRLDAIAMRVRGLNAELRTEVQGSVRSRSIQTQVGMLSRRSRVLHVGVMLSVVALVGFLGSSAVLFIALARFRGAGLVATSLFMLGLSSFGASLLTTLWEMLSAYRSLEEDIRSSRPRPE